MVLDIFQANKVSQGFNKVFKTLFTIFLKYCGLYKDYRTNTRLAWIYLNGIVMFNLSKIWENLVTILEWYKR